MKLVASALAIGFLAGALAGSRAVAAVPRPNFLVMLADDLGSHDVGWRGSEIKTPHLDKLALAGARLDQFYVQPVCSPTRAALLTGRYPMRHGLQVGVVRPWAQYGLPLEERTLSQALREAGYETALVGKWHLGHVQRDYLPTRRGFDHQYGHYNGAIDYFEHTRDGGFDWHRDDQVCRDAGYATELLGREAARFLREREASQPFLLYVAFNAPHAPHQAPAKYKEPYSRLPEPRRTYAGMVAAVDDAVGQIVAALDGRGWRTNTLILFSSDNGGPRPGAVSSNGSLRAGKGTLYEGGVKACAFATWEGRIKPGTLVKAPLHIVDWYPTVLRLAGVSLEQKLPLDGRDIWPVLTEGAPSPHEALLLNATPTKGALRAGDWKLLINAQATESPDGDEAGEPAIESNRRADAPAAVELYNLNSDPSERENVAAAHPGKVRELRAIYDRLAKQQVAPKAKPRPQGFQSPKVWGE